jgi:hypothetical protein
MTSATHIISQKATKLRFLLKHLSVLESWKDCWNISVIWKVIRIVLGGGSKKYGYYNANWNEKKSAFEVTNVLVYTICTPIVRFFGPFDQKKPLRKKKMAPIFLILK